MRRYIFPLTRCELVEEYITMIYVCESQMPEILDYRDMVPVSRSNKKGEREKSDCKKKGKKGKKETRKKKEQGEKK